ncbi:MAG: hypothetical protein WCO45_17205 [Pseudanabaena sp. ELA607]
MSDSAAAPSFIDQNINLKDVAFYEEAIANDPDTVSHYWDLGIALLLEGREEEAQMVWLTAPNDDDDNQTWLEEINQRLEIIATLQTQDANYQTAWLLRQYLYLNQPNNLHNLTQLGALSTEQAKLNPAAKADYQALGNDYLRQVISFSHVLNCDLQLLNTANQLLNEIYRDQGKFGLFISPNHNQAQHFGIPEGLQLNLGCGQDLRPGFINVDQYGNPDLHLNLEQFPWPWGDNSVSNILMSHVLEHLGQTSEIYLQIWQEIYRICQPNASIFVYVPHPRHDNFLSDPTHIRAITWDGLMMFSQAFNRQCIEQRAANTPLGLYLNIDFVLVHGCYWLDEPWRSNYIAGQYDFSEVNQLMRQYNNVVQQSEFELRVIK